MAQEFDENKAYRVLALGMAQSIETPTGLISTTEEGYPIHTKFTSFILTNTIEDAQEREVLLRVYSRALDEVCDVLLDSFALPNMPHTELVNHLWRDWLVLRLDKLWSGSHPYSSFLESQQDFDEHFKTPGYESPHMVRMVFGFTVIERTKPLPEPFSYVQLLEKNFNEGYTVKNAEVLKPSDSNNPA